ncbi:MAG TPA: LptF/LptG family permease [Treponemataceae bacterium]|nr:LptF/LptG family permease [Treponemataceae bacterium]HPS43269.1 LptF/LptG family permease [Treponemataceae bacterium]
MKLLQRYLLQQFIPVCVVSLVFFVFLLELGDLFSNLWKYLANEVPLKSVLHVLWLYIPKCVSFSMPLAVLFASSYTMGMMYARNELTIIFTSGYPLHLLVIPLLVAGLILSLFMFYFEDRVVIHSLLQKNTENRRLIQQKESLSNANIVVLSKSGRVVYTADFYDDEEKKIFSLMIVSRDAKGAIQSVTKAPSASWNGSSWVFPSYLVYTVDPKDGGVSVSTSELPETFDESPETFRKNTTSVDELTAKDAKVYIEGVRKAGLPYAEQLSNYYKRFSFPLTIFIVLFFSISLGGRFKKNILLMSLLLSLSVAVLYYIMQMVTMLLAKWEYISPLAGAWFPVVLFVFAGSAMLKYART